MVTRQLDLTILVMLETSKSCIKRPSEEKIVPRVPGASHTVKVHKNEIRLAIRG